MLARLLLLLFYMKTVVNYRTSMCLRNNEEFSLCGWKCPATCVNLRLLNSGVALCPSIWECRVGCRCSAGFIRDEYTKECVLVQHCPAFPFIYKKMNVCPIKDLSIKDAKNELSKILNALNYVETEMLLVRI